MKLFATFALTFLTACMAIPHESARPIKMEKGSAVDLRTQYDAAELVWHSMQRLGCRQIDVIYPEVVKRSADFQTGEGYVARGRVKERWIAHGCKMKIPYLVEFIASKPNAGGTDVYIRREQGGS